MEEREVWGRRPAFDSGLEREGPGLEAFSAWVENRTLSAKHSGSLWVLEQAIDPKQGFRVGIYWQLGVA